MSAAGTDCPNKSMNSPFATCLLSAAMVGGTITLRIVVVLLNTQGQEVNAVEGTILFPADALELRAIYEGGSIASFWVQKPALRQQGEVVFSGVMPGGIEDSKGFLFSLVFLAREVASVALETVEERVLLNDGQGSAAVIQRAPATLHITKTATGEEFVLLLDDEVPESFTPQIARDKDVFDGKWFVVFATQDKTSGIAGYSVLETTRVQRQEGTDEVAPREGSSWLAAESPYLLKDQELKSYVFVKALDKAGNERIAVLSPTNQRQWYENPVAQGILGLLVLVFLSMLYLVIKKKRRAKNILHLCIFVVSFLLFGAAGITAQAATLSVGPVGGAPSPQEAPLICPCSWIQKGKRSMLLGYLLVFLLTSCRWFLLPSASPLSASGPPPPA